MTTKLFDGNRDQLISFISTLNPNIDAQSVRLMDQLHHVSHSLMRIRELSLIDSGLSVAKFRILMSLMLVEQIEGRKNLNPSEISVMQGTSRNTVSSLIGDLESEGLITRRLDQADRRKFNIQLTEAGRAVVRENGAKHLEAVAQIFDIFDEQDQHDLTRLLAKLDRRALELIDS